MSSYDLEAREDAIAELAPIADGGSGQEVTITTPGAPGTPDPMTDTVSGASPPVTQHSSGVEISYRADNIDGTAIQRGDVLLLLSPVTLDGVELAEPVAGRDTVTKADGLWTIVHVETISPAGLVVLRKVQLRRGG